MNIEWFIRVLRKCLVLLRMCLLVMKFMIKYYPAALLG